MKKRFTLLMLAAGTMVTMKSQVIFQENFTPPYQAGWIVQNLSASANPTLTWFVPNAAGTFSAYNGGPDDYIAANYNNTTDQNNGVTISNWLMTPTLNIVNGTIVEFYTRIDANPALYADRLELRMSTAGTSSNVGSSPTSVNDFSVVLASVNPNLTSTGYPDTWTLYSATVTGVSTPTVGRFAFRYYVTDGGPAGSNSDYIGLDAVRVINPQCVATVQSYTVCPGSSATLTAMNAASGSTFTWTPGGANTSSIVVTPGTTTTYTLSYTESSGQCPDKTATVTVSNNLLITATSNPTSVCAGQAATLTASGGATQYGWSTFQTGPVITVTPSAGNNSYQVVGAAGTCTGMATVVVPINPNPTVTIAGTSLACVSGTGATVTFTASGANNYAWINGTTSNVLTLSIAAPTVVPGTQVISVTGTDQNGCTDTESHTITVSTQPTVSISSSTNIACTNSNIILTASGAGSYAWGGGATGNTVSVNSGTAAGTVQFSVTGNNSGCTATASITQSVVVCNTNPVGLGDNSGYQETGVFPNPFSNEIRITTLDGAVMIYNALGQVVISEKVDRNMTINTAHLPKGAYIVKAYNSNGEVVKTIKVVKN